MSELSRTYTLHILRTTNIGPDVLKIDIAARTTGVALLAAHRTMAVRAISHTESGMPPERRDHGCWLSCTKTIEIQDALTRVPG